MQQLLFGRRPQRSQPPRCPYSWLLDGAHRWPIAPTEGLLLYRSYYRLSSVSRASLPRLGYIQLNACWAVLGLATRNDQVAFQAAVISGSRADYLEWLSEPDDSLTSMLAQLDNRCLLQTGRNPRYQLAASTIAGHLAELRRQPPLLLDLTTGRRFPPVWWMQQRNLWPPQAGQVPDSCWNARSR
jgi:hypothetical protein